MSPKLRQGLLLGGLVLAALLVVFGDNSPPAGEDLLVVRQAPAATAPVEPAESAVAKESAQVELAPGEIRRIKPRPPRGEDDNHASLFPGPPPPPPMPEQGGMQQGEPPPPPSPTHPFAYIGRMLDQGRWTIFLSNAGWVHALSEGGEADGFRVESISAHEVRLAQLANDVKFVIPIDDAKKD
jgi:hypothetical protein